VQGRLEKSAKFVLGHQDFMTLGASRTDAGVSCSRGAFELFNVEDLDVPEFVNQMNTYLPDDIRILDGQKVSEHFNIIHNVVAKEYGYYFSFGQKFHPFAAANLTHVNGILDIDLIRIGAALFIGKHNFRGFCTKNKQTEDFSREIFKSEVEFSNLWKGSVLPEDIYCFRVRGSGFLTHQVRIMMQCLFDLGQNKIGLTELKQALESPMDKPLFGKAPAHGLVLEEVEFNF
jgi:tRNA pseudouridine38-40 synthase